MQMLVKLIRTVSTSECVRPGFLQYATTHFHVVPSLYVFRFNPAKSGQFLPTPNLHRREQPDSIRVSKFIGFNSAAWGRRPKVIVESTHANSIMRMCNVLT